ncbi:shikimate kinase [Lysinibacter cavernae]|uniref:Shikimate kinase n=1 Tax=Lysinibacter cavernae TaxID=1640652 RepID=A0A7X5TSK5_9MICO|nr:shikimate kinase [Lysinibacter cavernae]NIH53140.1 shikimate kinase [Lysinibacter cavernae]
MSINDTTVNNGSQPSDDRHKAIVFIGPTGVGKSAIGQAFAHSRDIGFVDSDAVFVERFGSIPAFFAEHGEIAFREREAIIVADILARPPFDGPYVLSVGGGAILNPDTRALIAKHTVVWLDTELEFVLPRLLGQPDRPLLTGDVAAQWQRIADERRHLYEESATLRFDASTGSVDELVQRISLALMG